MDFNFCPLALPVPFPNLKPAAGSGEAPYVHPASSGAEVWPPTHFFVFNPEKLRLTTAIFATMA